MKVALVEFLNAYPLYFALQKNIIKHNFEFYSYPPSVCAMLLRDKKVDVGNVPIIEYAKGNYKIIKDCCIASNKEVKSVVLFLNKPINSVRKVKLDSNSNTSVALTKILFRFKYNITVDYAYDGYADCELVIGDKALKRIKENENAKRLDLAVEWNRFTGLPFVFAAWLSNIETDEKTKELFIKSKEWGKSNIDIICESANALNLISKDECLSYLRNNISYDLDEHKIESIKQFLFYAKQCGIIDDNPELKFTC